MAETNGTKQGSSDKKAEVVIEKSPEQIQQETEALLYADLKNYCEEVNKTGITKELRFLSRSLRQTFARLRRKLNEVMMAKILNEYFPEGETRNNLTKFFPAVPEVPNSITHNHIFNSSL
jgi:hypothetical protein